MVAGEVVQPDQGQGVAGAAAALSRARWRSSANSSTLAWTVRQGSRVGSWKT